MLVRKLPQLTLREAPRYRMQLPLRRQQFVSMRRQSQAHTLSTKAGFIAEEFGRNVETRMGRYCWSCFDWSLDICHLLKMDDVC